MSRKEWPPLKVAVWKLEAGNQSSFPYYRWKLTSKISMRKKSDLGSCMLSTMWEWFSRIVKNEGILFPHCRRCFLIQWKNEGILFPHCRQTFLMYWKFHCSFTNFALFLRGCSISVINTLMHCCYCVAAHHYSHIFIQTWAWCCFSWNEIK